MSARTTEVSPDGERLLDDLTTVRAPLRGEVRRYLVNSNPGALSLEFEYGDEVGPACVRDGFREVLVFGHTADVEVFDHNNGVAIIVRSRRLVGMVLSLASNLEVSLREVASRLLTPRGLALRPPKLLVGAAIEARVFEHLAFGICKKDLQPNVEANGGTVSFLRRFSKIADDEHVPVPIDPQNEVSGLGSAFERPVLPDLDPAAELLRDMQPLRFGVEEYVSPNTVLPELYRVPAVGTLEAREAGLLPKLLTVQKPFEGFIQAVGKRLDGALWDVLAATPFKAIGEIVTAKKLTHFDVMVFDYLKHLVIYPAALRQARKELSMLDAGGIKPVFEGFVHPLCSTASGYCAQRSFTGRLKATALWAVFL
jgi:hypothetical protein